MSPLSDALTEVITSTGPRSASDLAHEVRRRKADVLRELHAGRFRQVGRGRASRWVVLPAVDAALLRRYEAAVLLAPTLHRDERPLLLASVLWPDDELLRRAA